MDVTDQLRHLEEQRRLGMLTDDEFARAKLEIGAGLPASIPTGPPDREAKNWAMGLHLSQFAGHAVPLAGLILPIVLWQLKKDEVPGLDAHGKAVANWVVSEVIYLVASIILMVVLIGVPLFFVLLGLGIVFPIIGAVKASSGEVWKYPLSISFFK